MFTVDSASPVPVYEQLTRCVVDAIASGQVSTGDRIPPVRALATELGVAAGTVAKAYRTLEANGVIETRGRQGTFIAQSSDDRHRAAHRAAVEFVEYTVGQLHYSPQECVHLVERALARGGVGGPA